MPELGCHDLRGSFERYCTRIKQRSDRIFLPVGRRNLKRIFATQAMLYDHAREDQAARVVAVGACRRTFPRHQRGARHIVESVGREARQAFMLRLGRDVSRECDRAID